MIDQGSLIVVIVAGRGLLDMPPLDVALPCLDVLRAGVSESVFGASTLIILLLLPSLFPH